MINNIKSVNFFKYLIYAIPIASLFHFIVYYFLNLFNSRDIYLYIYFSEHMGGRLIAPNQYDGEDSLMLLGMFIVFYVLFEYFILFISRNVEVSLLKYTSIKILKILFIFFGLVSICLLFLMFPVWLALISGFVNILLILLFNYVIIYFYSNNLKYTIFLTFLFILLFIFGHILPEDNKKIGGDLDTLINQIKYRNAIKGNDPQKCFDVYERDSHRRGYFRYQCFFMMAMKTKDVDLCNYICKDTSDQLYGEVESCKIRIVKEKPDINVCAEIIDDSNKDWCYTYVACGISDEKICELVKSDYIKENYCFTCSY